MNDIRSFSFTPGVLSLPQAAHYLANCSLRTIDRLVDEGELEKRFVKGTIPGITLKSLNAYIERLPQTKGSQS